MPGEGGSPKGRPAVMVRTLIVVARDQPHLWQSLREHCAGTDDVKVLLDRRMWERRRRVWSYGRDRRELDRRRPISIENDVHYRQYIIVRSQHGTVGN